MKAGAITRIVIFSILFLVLLGLLIGGLCIGFVFNNAPSGETTTVERRITATEFSKLEIEWAAGSVKIITGLLTDEIIVRETKDTNNPYTLVTEFDNNTLRVCYANDISFHFGSLSGKDLTIIVPKEWICRSLEIDGAALDIGITDINVDYMELNGASAKLNLNGNVSKLECNGAATKLNLTCTEAPDQISIDGAACDLDLTLPKNSGFAVDADGVAINFNSNCDYIKNGNNYTYGNESCEIEISGVGCKVTVNQEE